MRNKIIIFYGLFDEHQTSEWIPYSPIILYSLLKSSGFEPILIHEYADQNYEKIISENASQTLFFGVSSMTGYQINSGIKAIKIFRKYEPGAPIVWGGAHATAIPYQTLLSEYVDYVHVGWASEFIINFARALQEGKEISGIPNILSLEYFERKETIKHSIEEIQTDFSNFPRIQLRDFNFSYLMTENNVLNYITSVGCRGQCTFCSWGGLHPWSCFKYEHILDDIEYLYKQYKLSTLWFADASLTANKEYVVRLARDIRERDIDMFWRCNGRVSELRKFSSEDFRTLERSGLDQIFIGVENTNYQIQKKFKKALNPETVTEIVTKMKDYQIRIFMSFIFGNPGVPLNDLEENRRYIDKWKKINPNVRYQVCMYTPYPGTPMTDLAVKSGYIPPSGLEEYGQDVFFNTGHRKDISLPWHSNDERIKYNKKFIELFKETDNSEWCWRNNGIQ